MKFLGIALGALTIGFACLPTEASAVVCARGVVRAGCVGPAGAVAVRRPVPRAVVVAPARRGCAIVNGRRVCRY
jgi:hypothetical protein